jgi:beta-phosphoglucomutase
MIKAVIFDLDGVIVSTDDCHYKAWKKLADQKGIYFDREINERLRGISRMGSLEILLERSTVQYSQEEKETMAEEKNRNYVEMINELSPDDILPGVLECMETLKQRSIPMAIGSSSKNAMIILTHIGLDKYFDAIIDGNSIQKSKPDPEVFILAAEKLGIDPSACLVIEDADSGVNAAKAAKMLVMGVGFASENQDADLRFSDIKDACSKGVFKCICR